MSLCSEIKVGCLEEDYSEYLEAIKNSLDALGITKEDIEIMSRGERLDRDVPVIDASICKKLLKYNYYGV